MLTPYQIEKTEYWNFDVFSVEIAIEKERKKLKKRFQNKCVSSQNKKREERALP